MYTPQLNLISLSAAPWKWEKGVEVTCNDSLDIELIPNTNILIDFY